MTIRSKLPTKEYMENWERIFRPKEPPLTVEDIKKKQAQLQGEQLSLFDKQQVWHDGE